MFQSNSTFGIYSSSLVVLLRNKKYLFFILFLLLYPLILIINRIFLFLDYILVPEFEKAKVKEPVFIMGVNRSGTTFFHKLISKSNQFSTSKTWDLIIPSLSLRKFLSILSYALNLIHHRNSLLSMFIEIILKMKIEIFDLCYLVKIFSKDKHF